MRLRLSGSASYLVCQVAEDGGTLEDSELVVAVVNETGNTSVGVDLGGVFGILDGALAFTEAQRHGVV